MKASEMRSKSIEELETEQLAMRRELFNLRIQKGIGQSTQTHLLRNVKKRIARAKTIQSEKEGSSL